MSTIDPQWIKFPRWIELSGIPQRVCETLGVEAWLALRKLIEFDCDKNITPDWFTFPLKDLADYTGLMPEIAALALARLAQAGWIERRNSEFDVQDARIATPMPSPVEESKIREKLGTAYIILRYNQDLTTLQPVEKVVYLYQMIFGTRFNPRIAEDLEEIATNYEMGVIFDIFSEAHQKKVKSLSWVKSQLNKKVMEQKETEESPSSSLVYENSG